jgi:hypothetical protein
MNTRRGLLRPLCFIIGAYLFVLTEMLCWHCVVAAPYYEQASAPLLILMGLSAALASLLSIWGALASLHWPKRMAGAVAGTAILVALLAGLFDWPVYFLWQLIVELAVSMFMQVMVLSGTRLLGYELAQSTLEGDAVESPRSAVISQLSVRDLFLLVTAFALLFAAMRSMQPAAVQSWLYPLLSMAGMAAGLVGLGSAWCVLSRSPIFWRGLALIFIAPLGGLVYLALEQFSRTTLLFGPKWYAGVTLLEVLFMLPPLWILRAHGWRIARRHDSTAM